MTTEEYVKYMTRAKGAFLSRYNIPITNIRLLRENDVEVEFEIESYPSSSGIPKRVRITIEK